MYDKCFLLLAVAAVTNIKHTLASTNCYDAYECADTTIEETDTSGSNKFINCLGLSSCMNSVITTSTSDASYLRCYAEQACSNAQATHTIEDDNEDISVSCLGDRSCINSSITLTGDQSNGADSSIRVSFSGRLSFENGLLNIVNSENGDATIEFDGASSGHGATINCNSGSTCEIICSVDACNNLTLLCDGAEYDSSSSDCSYNIDCDWAEYSDTCPNGYKLDTIGFNQLLELDPSPYDYVNISTSTIYNSVTICDYNGTAIAFCCDEYYECNENTYVVDSELQLFRCDGYYSCGDILNITMIPDGSSDDGTDIYATGERGLYKHTDEKTIVNENGGNVYCFGLRSCYRVEFYNVNDIYCTSSNSCYETSIYNANNIYMYGARSSLFVVTRNIRSNVYCMTDYSCANLNVSNVTGNIYSIGLSSINLAIINDVQGGVFVYGGFALSGTIISNANQLTVAGEYGCDLCTLEGVQNINILHGVQVLSNANITSSNGGLNLTISANVTNTGNFNLFCSENDICNIFCGTTEACSKMELFCTGTCIVTCMSCIYVVLLFYLYISQIGENDCNCVFDN